MWKEYYSIVILFAVDFILILLLASFSTGGETMDFIILCVCVCVCVYMSYIWIHLAVTFLNSACFALLSA